MADFIPCYERMILNEGGYKLHTVENDRGGMTYAGIARNMNPHWKGWKDIDAGGIPDTSLVREFYKVEFWDRIRGDDLVNQDVARMLFDFGVNAGWRTALKLAQLTVGVQPDGVVGPKTLNALNACNPELFVLQYSFAKIVRYRDIVTKNRTQQKFLLGWINRTIKELT